MTRHTYSDQFAGNLRPHEPLAGQPLNNTCSLVDSTGKPAVGFLALYFVLLSDLWRTHGGRACAGRETACQIGLREKRKEALSTIRPGPEA